MEVDYKCVEKRLGIPVSSSKLFERVARNLSSEKPQITAEVARLRFAGKVLIRLFTMESLFRSQPDRREGSMTRWRDTFITTRIHDLGSAMGLNVRMTESGLSQAFWRPREMLVRETQVAFGAIYSEYGFRACRSAFMKCAEGILEDVVRKDNEPGLAFQEMVRLRFSTYPRFKRLDDEPVSGKVVVGCYVKGILVATAADVDVEMATTAVIKRCTNSLEVWTPEVLQGRECHGAEIPNEIAPKMAELEKRLDLSFTDKHILYQAILHSSFHLIHPSPNRHNERLEFLGDAVLEWVVVEFLLEKFPDNLTKAADAKTSLVANRRLAEVAAEKFDLRSFVQFGPSELLQAEMHPEARKKVLADAFEAIVGAVYLDQGIGACRLLVDASIHSHFTAAVDNDKVRIANHPKTLLNNLLARHRLPTVRYEWQEPSGPMHMVVHRCSAMIEDEVVGVGTGNNKREAEYSSAQAALELMTARLTSCTSVK